MAVRVVANEKAKDEFEFPVSWEVLARVKVRANSLNEALEWFKEHIDEVPLNSGEDTAYVDASYQINADDIEEAICYQNTEADVVCTNFWHDDDLTKYTDSMLFDSEETSVAEGTFVYKGDEITLYLDVCGEVSVTFEGETYNKPSEFPDALKELIKNNPNHWDTDWEHGVEYVGDNNWFEYLIPSNGDGEVFEDDLSKATPEKILEDMKKIARQYFGIEE